MSTTIRRRLAVGLFAGAAALSLTACGNFVEGKANDASAPTLPEPQTEEEANASADAAATSTPSGPSTNARGNIVKTLGEEGGLTNEDGTTLFTFAIDSITPDVPCPGDYSSPPENGHLTAVSTDTDYLSVSAYDFSFIGSNGLTFTNVATVATYSCLEESTLFPSAELQPGSQYAGAVLLDLPEAAGTLIYRPSSVSGGGWEISY
jgi:hypothetical protein